MKRNDIKLVLYIVIIIVVIWAALKLLLSIFWVLAVAAAVLIYLNWKDVKRILR